MVDRYLSITHPLRRYEFMSQIKWQNSQLHDDLIGSEIIIQRGGARVEEDTWLDPDASYRHYSWHHEQRQQQQLALLPQPQPQPPLLLLAEGGSSLSAAGAGGGGERAVMVGEDVQPIWFCWEEDTRSWEPFQPHECRRLERAYRRHLLASASNARRRGRTDRVMSWGETSDAMDSDRRGTGGGTTSHYSGGESSDRAGGGGGGGGAGGGGGGAAVDVEVGLYNQNKSLGAVPCSLLLLVSACRLTYARSLDTHPHLRTLQDSSPFSPENSGPLLQHEVGPDDVFVDQGRYVVNLTTMAKLPVFWGYMGQVRGASKRHGLFVDDDGVKRRRSN